MTLEEISKFIEPKQNSTVITQELHTNLVDDHGVILSPFNPGVLNDNFGGVPEMDSDYERFLQDRVTYPANKVGYLAYKLFLDGIEQEANRTRQAGEKQGSYTYWVRQVSDDSEGSTMYEFGVRGGSERPAVQSIMARCAIENGLPSRDVSENALSAFVLELSMYEEIDQQATQGAVE